MNELKSIENRGTEAVRQLRLRKLLSGNPFMINSNELSTDHCYLEYPDGSIKLAKIESSARDFTIIRELTTSEALTLRKRFNFSI